MLSLVYLGGAVLILKISLWCTVAGFSVTVLLDKDVHRLVKKVGGMFHVKQSNKFNLENEHATVIGLTQHGKTYGTIKTLERMNEPILFFNSQRTPVGEGWVEADSSNTAEQVIYALKNGYRVNFLPADESIDKMSRQLGAITEAVYKEGKMSFRFAIDEVHLFWMGKDKAGREALIRLATTGLGRGFKCIFLSQRPAKVDNTLYTQSTKHIIFALGKMDESYLKTNGFPVAEIVEKTGNEKYNYVEFDQKQVKGSFRIL
jgi:hypothetical protein